MNRRDCLFGGAGLLTASLVAGKSLAQAQPATLDGNVPRNWGFVSPRDDPAFGNRHGADRGAVAVGAGLSRHDEVRTAFRLLFDAPRTNDHMAIARYFMNIKDVNREKPGEPYNQEWRTRANPLIVGFFSMTNTLPAEGDVTHWCAAFVSFCLYAAGKPNKFSALSGAYRNFGEATNTPAPGDLAVFRLAGKRGDMGFGHVGFFVDRKGSKIRVLGGNQKGNTNSTGAITEADYDAQNPALQLYGFRKIRA